MSPSITPTVAGTASYAISDSAAFVVDLELDSNQFDTRSFTINHPDRAPGLAIVLRHGTVDVDLDALTGTDTQVSGGRSRFRPRRPGPVGSTSPATSPTPTGATGSINRGG